MESCHGPVCRYSGLNLHHISELHTFENSAVRVLDVDAVMENNAASLFRHFAEENSGFARASNDRYLKIRQINALVIGDVHVIVQMEIEYWHGHQSVCRCA